MFYTHTNLSSDKGSFLLRIGEMRSVKSQDGVFLRIYQNAFYGGCVCGNIKHTFHEAQTDLSTFSETTNWIKTYI
jgi:hypothetical protein